MVSEAAKKKAALKKASVAAKHKGLAGNSSSKSKTAEEANSTTNSSTSVPSRLENENFTETRNANGSEFNNDENQIKSNNQTLNKVTRISFPPILTSRQRAILHEFAEENNLKHGSVGETESTRKLVLWKEDKEGDEEEEGSHVHVSFKENTVSDNEIAEVVHRLFGINAFDKFDSKKGNETSKNSNSKDNNRNKNSNLKIKTVDRITLDEFVTRMSPLIQLEKDAELEASIASYSNLKPEKAQKKGSILFNLKCTEADKGLLGKTLLILQSNKSQSLILPNHKFHPHDVVAIKPNKSQSDAVLSSSATCQGIVYRVRDQSITIAVDDIPEDSIDSPLRIEKLVNDVTYKRMKETLIELSKGVRNGPASELTQVLFGSRPPKFSKPSSSLSFFNKDLDESQRRAVQLALSANDVALLHGPPGTGKTTAVVEIIQQEVKKQKKVLVCAASNIAVDNLVERLNINNKIKIVRLGHPARLLPSVLSSALDAQVLKTDNSALANDVRKEIKTLNQQLLKAKDRREKGEIRRELKRLGKEEMQREQKAVNDVIKDSDVILATLTGAMSRQLNGVSFDLTVIDEAAQALEIACWNSILKSKKVLLAGDHLQLPPTVQSKEAEKNGFSITMFERLISLYGKQITALLTTQYRMHADIMRWSSNELYEGQLTAHASVASRLLTQFEGVSSSSSDASPPLILIDTSGCDMEESREEEGDSWRNEGEASVIIEHAKRLIAAGVSPKSIGIISPYSAQVGLLKEIRNNEKMLLGVEISTVDGFQGREKAAILISMVRSNPRKEVGFLADNRRMNVAVTRAQRQCCVVCDSDTVSNDAFLKRMIQYFESNGELLSAMEYVN